MMLDPRALCSLEDVKVFGYKPDSDQLEVDFWLDCINAASDAIHEEAEREFVAENAARTDDNEPVTVATETRLFDVDRCAYDADTWWETWGGWPGAAQGQYAGGYILEVGDLAQKRDGSAGPAAIRIKDLAGALLQTVTLSTVVSLPRIRKPWQPVTELWFLEGLSGSAQISPSTVIEVDCKWGFPAIPAGLRRACANQAALWYARDVKHYASTFNLESGRFEIVRSDLAPAIAKTARRYKRPRMG
jgi:hypothetical protein